MTEDTPESTPALERPPVRGQALWDRCDRALQALDHAIHRVLPPALNPLTQTGAIANVAFLVAAASGVALMIWYSPSVHNAYDSIQAMEAQPWGGGWVRSMHRYSSDATMLFVLFHAAKLFFAGRYTGPRWLAWITGMVLVTLLWFVGWTGYWLVWDEPARQVALGTAKMLDLLPIFPEPVARSFLVDEAVNSLFFFVVFFTHMVVPLVMGAALWLHITRLSRSKFLTTGPMTWWVLGTMAAMSLVFAAAAGGPARMAEVPGSVPLDGWYLAPLALVERLEAGALWALALVVPLVLYSLPWALAKGAPPPAIVKESRCNACTKCYQDCPYDAIRMVPRTDGDHRYDKMAWVDVDKCVGCGICAGSCDSSAIGLDWLKPLDVRKQVDGWLDAQPEDGACVAFACRGGAGGQLGADPVTGRCAALPGWRVMTLPCVGHAHPLTVERAARHGARGVLMVACEPGDCTFREGAAWAEERMSGAREPALRPDKAPINGVRVVHLGAGATGALVAAARELEQGLPAARRAPRGRLAGVVAAALLAGCVVVGSRLPYTPPQPTTGALVVTFKHPGGLAEACRPLTEEEIAARPAHMRVANAMECSRQRADVRLRVTVDGAVALERAYAPGGLWGDRLAVVLERVAVEPGKHRVSVEIGDTIDQEKWSFVSEGTIEAAVGRQSVVVFDRTEGFEWY